MKEIERSIADGNVHLKLQKSFDIPESVVLGLTGWRLALKRVLDIVIALVVLPLTLPVWMIAALAIKSESKGPVLFRQTRVGKNGKPFTMYKFRSMYQDAEVIRLGLESLNELEGPVFKIRNDPRVTRVGSFLRRTSLDECPQLINVLKGEMSLVGPRPALPGEVENYDSRQLRRLSVMPGLTCLWQVQGRSNLAFHRWVELDLEYIENQSLLLDFKILLKTIPAVLKGSGAW